MTLRKCKACVVLLILTEYEQAKLFSIACITHSNTEKFRSKGLLIDLLFIQS